MARFAKRAPMRLAISPFRLATALAIAVWAAAPAVAADPLAAIPEVSPAVITVTAQRAAPASPDVLGTAALDAGVTIYDVRFRRVAAADRDNPQINAIAAQLAGLTPVEQVMRAKEIVERRVRFASDLDTMKVADYWSSAGDTLRRGAGDDEDIAIVEMQVLRAAGFRANDLYISIGRHRTRGAHAVLMARTPQGFYMLDQAEASALPAGSKGGAFVPMLTIGTGRSWIHGYRLTSSAVGGH